LEFDANTALWLWVWVQAVWLDQRNQAASLLLCLIPRGTLVARCFCVSGVWPGLQ